MLISLWTNSADPLDELVEWVYNAIHSAAGDVWSWFADVGGVHLGGTGIVAPVQSNMSVLVMASYMVMIVTGGLVLMTHETLQTRYSFKEIAPRLVMGLGLVWAAPLILEAATEVNADVVDALIDIDGKELDHWSLRAHEPDTLVTAMGLMTTNSGVSQMSLLAIISVVLAFVGAIVLLVSAMMRWLAMLAVVALAPLALAAHGLPFTEAAARMWWRTLAACMASSIGQAGCLYLWRYIAFDTDGKARAGLDDLSDPTLNGYYLGMAYMLITIWAMWKVHASAFQWARGRSVRFPGSRLAKGLAIAAAAGWVRRRGYRKPHKTSTASRAQTAEAKFRLSTGWKNPDGTTRSIRVQRPKFNPKGMRRAKAKAGLATHAGKDSRDIGVEPWDLKHWPAGAEYPRRDPKRPIAPIVADGPDSRVRVKRGLSTSGGIVRRMGTRSLSDTKRLPGKARVPRATPSLPVHSTRRQDQPDSDALVKASQRLRRDQINRNVARQAAANRHLERRATPSPKPRPNPKLGER